MRIGGLGLTEIAIIVVVLLLIFGATRLPKIGSSLGHSMRAFRDAITGRDQPESDSDSDESKDKVKSASKDGD